VLQLGDSGDRDSAATATGGAGNRARALRRGTGDLRAVLSESDAALLQALLALHWWLQSCLRMRPKPDQTKL
jgi:hypothetical protein